MTFSFDDWAYEFVRTYNTIVHKGEKITNPRKIHKYEPHCCCVLVLDLSSFLENSCFSKNIKNVQVFGQHYEKSKNAIRFMHSVDLEEPKIWIYPRSCYDICELFIFLQNNNENEPKTAIYCSSFSPCAVLSNKIKFKEDREYYTDKFIKFFRLDFLKVKEYKQVPVLLMKHAEENLNTEFYIKNLKKDTDFHYGFDLRMFQEPNAKNISVFNNVYLEHEKNKCILCFRYFEDLENFLIHCEQIHFQYSVSSWPTTLSTYVPSKNTVALFKNPEKNIIVKVNQISLPEKLHQDHFINYKRVNEKNDFNITDGTFVYISKSYERGKYLEMKNRYRYTIYRTEIMEDTSDEVCAPNFVKIVQDRKIKELVDVSESQLLFMRKWNVFITSRKNAVNFTQLPDLVLEYLKTESDRQEGLNFLFTLYQKCSLTQKDIRNILSILTQ